MKCGLRTTYIKTALESKTERNRKRTSKNSSLSFSIPLAVHVVYSSQGEGRLCRYSRQLKLNSEFYKKKELEEISICSFKPIRSTELKTTTTTIPNPDLTADQKMSFSTPVFRPDLRSLKSVPIFGPGLI